MVDRLVVDVDADGTASVLTGGDLPRGRELGSGAAAVVN